MRAVVINETGDFDALELCEVPDPKPEVGEVLIDIAYCGCNWADTQIRKGTYPHPIIYPFIAGFEVSGTVIACGDGVSNVKTGDRVATMLPKGEGYAEQCVVDAEWLIPLADEIPFDVGAAFPIQAITAYHMLHTVYDLKADEYALVHAAGGGVGLCLIQLAVLAGAHVIGTVGTPGKEVKPLKYGAKRIINLNDDSEDFVSVVMDMTENRGVDVALDSLGGETLDRTFDAVKFLGQIVNIGEGQGVPFKNIRERILLRSQNFCRFTVFHVMPGTESWTKCNRYLTEAIVSGSLEMSIVETYPLERAGEMHKLLEGRSVSGKLLLSMKG